MVKNMKVALSLLAADFCNLAHEINRVNDTSADYLHLDIMDGNFVPNISFGPGLIKTLRPLSNKLFDVHLMITNPLKYLEVFKDAGADLLTYHYETNLSHQELIKEIHSLKMKAGLSIKPNTDVKVLEEYLPMLDLVLIMSVEPGFGGQSFMTNCLEKIAYLKAYREKHKLTYLIEVDGGINDETSKLVAKAGADIIVSGTYLFHSQDMKTKVEELQKICA